MGIAGRGSSQVCQGASGATRSMCTWNARTGLTFGWMYSLPSANAGALNMLLGSLKLWGIWLLLPACNGTAN